VEEVYIFVSEVAYGSKLIISSKNVTIVDVTPVVNPPVVVTPPVDA
jgi:hypothetical protein